VGVLLSCQARPAGHGTREIPGGASALGPYHAGGRAALPPPSPFETMPCSSHVAWEQHTTYWPPLNTGTEGELTYAGWAYLLIARRRGAHSFLTRSFDQRTPREASNT
jgi:hypothetical protein